MNPDGMVALLNYRVSSSTCSDIVFNASSNNQEDGVTRKYIWIRISRARDTQSTTAAYFTFWKDGVKEEKL